MKIIMPNNTGEALDSAKERLLNSHTFITSRVVIKHFFVDIHNLHLCDAARERAIKQLKEWLEENKEKIDHYELLLKTIDEIKEEL